MPKYHRPKINILFCSTALSYGGEQKQLAKAINYLDRKRFNPLICCIRPYEYVDPAIEYSGTEIICLETRSRYNILGAVSGLCRVVRQRNIHLIRMTIFGSEFAALITAMIMRVPVVAFLTSMYDITPRLATSQITDFRLKIKWKLICLGHAILSRIVKVHYAALSPAIKKSAMKNFYIPANRIEIIPLSIVPDNYYETQVTRNAGRQLRNDLNLDGAYPVLLNVARLSPVKGQNDLLKAMPRILEEFPRARLLIAGDGKLRNELERLNSKMGLQGHVSLLGRRDDIATLLYISDFFVFSSYYEGQAEAVIEAMAAGKPVVAFDIPALQEAIEDKRSGVLVPNRNHIGLADVIIELAGQRDKALKMGKRGRQIVKEKHNIKNVEMLIEAAYLEMVLPA
jgi:glycosyltransferase involved in cell wall biosynthesis